MTILLCKKLQKKFCTRQPQRIASEFQTISLKLDRYRVYSVLIKWAVHLTILILGYWLLAFILC